MPRQITGVPGGPCTRLRTRECHPLAPWPPSYTNTSALQERDNVLVILNSLISKNVYKKSVRSDCSYVVRFFFFSISSLDLLAYFSCRKCYNHLPDMCDISIIKWLIIKLQITKWSYYVLLVVSNGNKSYNLMPMKVS